MEVDRRIDCDIRDCSAVDLGDENREEEEGRRDHIACRSRDRSRREGDSGSPLVGGGRAVGGLRMSVGSVHSFEGRWALHWLGLALFNQKWIYRVN